MSSEPEDIYIDNDPIESLNIIFKTLDNLKYELSGREYTLTDDEMGWVFYCRDVAEEALRKLGVKNVG
jgi:hypothetical protein